MIINTLKFKQLYRILLVIIGLLYNSYSQAAIISHEVQNALITDDSAMVIISLYNPVRKLRTISRDSNSAIWFAQEYVLAALPAGSFEQVYRYKSVPALTGRVTQAAVAVLANHPQVLSVQLDVPDTVNLVQSVRWIKADKVHTMTPTAFTGQGVTVAVLDTGIDTDHPDLVDDIIGQHCFLAASVTDGKSGCPTTACSAPFNTAQESCNAEDDHGHGTHVTGIVTSKGTIVSLVGVAKNAEIIAVKVCNSSSKCYPSDVIAALDWLKTQSIDIVNMSLGGNASTNVTDCENDTPAYVAAVNLLFDKGIPIFASTGNDGYTDKINRPACYSNTIAVGATYDANVGAGNWSPPGCSDGSTAPDKVVCFSNSNNLVDVLAPGAVIVSSWIGGTTLPAGGTSQAVPTAVGVAALMLEANPTLTPTCIKTILKETGVSITDVKNGLTFPRVDALAAVNTALLEIFQFSKTNYTVSENGGSVAITVTRTGNGAGTVSVAYETVDATAIAGKDYTATSGTLTWFDGDSSDKTFIIPILDDNDIEGNETVTLNLPSNSCVYSATLTIADYEEGALQFSTANYTVNENAGTLTIEVARSGGSNGNVTVDYVATDISAINGNDYTITNGMLTWNDNDSANKSFTINILEDKLIEDTETITLTLMSPTGGATLGTPNSVNLTILDNDKTSDAILDTPNSVNLTILDNDKRTINTISSPILPSFTLITFIGGDGNGYVETQPAGIHCYPGGNGTCHYTFTTNEPITLIPTAFPGSRFQNWGGHPDCAEGIVSTGGKEKKYCGVYFVKLIPPIHN